MTTVYVAIGSNVEPETRMLQAARALKQQFTGTRFSRCYRNPAYGYDGPDFLNAVVGFETALPINALKESLQQIERDCGRQPTDAKWGPRSMDLDLLLFGGLVGTGPGYTLPRRDLLQRVYMLGPLAEIAPQWQYPPSGPSIEVLWSELARTPHGLVPIDLDLNAA